MTIQIKRYANRKLHVEGSPKYLSMLELSELATQNPDLKVVCDRTGRDMTLESLSRALYERLKDYFDESRYLETGRQRTAPFPARDLTRLLTLVPTTRKKAQP